MYVIILCFFLSLYYFVFIVIPFFEMHFAELTLILYHINLKVCDSPACCMFSGVLW